MNNGIYLCRPGGSILGTLSGIDENSVQLTQQVGQPWELSFDVMRYIEKDCQLVESTYYRSLSSGMEIYLETEKVSARFQIDNEPDIRNEGAYEFKTIIAVSIECELQDKMLHNFSINTGTTASLENLVMGNLKEEAVDINDTSQELYNFNYDPYKNLPVDYIYPYNNCLVRMETEFIFDVENNHHYIQWTKKNDDGTTQLVKTLFDVSSGTLVPVNPNEHDILVEGFTELLKEFPRMNKDIRWSIDDDNKVDQISPPDDKVVCTIESYITVDKIGATPEVYLTYPEYVYELRSDGWHITGIVDHDDPANVPTWERFETGWNRLKSFYQKFGSQLSLLDLAIEQVKVSGWSIGNVPKSLDGKYFTYTIDNQDIYSFLTKNVASSMKLVVDFDRINKKVNLIDVFDDDATHDTGIVIGFHNLMNSIDIKSNSDDGIKTKFNVSGANDLGILYGNFGSNSIIDLDYFMDKIDEYGNRQYVDDETYTNYKAWLDFRDKDAYSVTIPIYEYNPNTKEIIVSSTKTITGTRREVYTELSKYYNQSLVDTDEIINLVPNDGVRTDFMTYSYDELCTVYTAFVNAFNALLSLYKDDYNVAVMHPNEAYINPNDRIEESAITATKYDGQQAVSILDTMYGHDFKSYYYNIIPNVVQSLKRFVETEDDADLTIVMYPDGSGGESWRYLDGGNPYYNSDSDRLEHLSSDAYKYDMSLYGRDELMALKKSWIVAATKIFKEEFVKTGTSIDDYTYNTWTDLSPDQKAKFTDDTVYQEKLDDYLDYTSRTVRQNKLVSEATYGKAYAKNISGNYKKETKGVIYMTQDEIDKCETLLATLEQSQKDYFDARKAIADSVTLEGFAKTHPTMNLGVINSLIVEADYNNSNILTTNLDSLGLSKNDEKTVTDVQVELLDDAKKRLFEKSRPQYSFTATMDNLLALEEFKPLVGSVQLLNYIYLRIGLYDDETVRLRLVKIQHNPIIPTDEITLEFSNMTYTYDGINDLAHLFDEMSGGGSSGGSSGGGSGGVYGANDAEITLSNNMLNALLKNKSYVASVNATTMQVQRLVANSIESGEIKVGDYATTGELENGLEANREYTKAHYSSSDKEWNTYVPPYYGNIILYSSENPNNLIDDTSSKYNENYDPTKHSDIIGKYCLNETNGDVYQAGNSNWTYVATLESIQSYTQTTVDISAKGVTSTVASSVKTWNLQGISYTIDNYGFGIPTNDDYTPVNNTYFLDQTNGVVYKGNGNNWVRWQTLNSIEAATYSQIEQTADGITSSVAESIDTWDTLSYTIDIRDFGTPDNEDYPPEDYDGKYYLDLSTGSLYVSNGRAWQFVRSLPTNVSQIKQRADSIDLSVSQSSIWYFDEMTDDNLIGVVLHREDLYDLSPSEGDYAILDTQEDDEGYLYCWQRSELDPSTMTWEEVGYAYKKTNIASIVLAVNDSGSEIRLSADKVKTGKLQGLNTNTSWIDLDNDQFHFGGSNGYIDWNNYGTNQLRLKGNISSANDLMLGNISVVGTDVTNSFIWSTDPLNRYRIYEKKAILYPNYLLIYLHVDNITQNIFDSGNNWYAIDFTASAVQFQGIPITVGRGLLYDDINARRTPEEGEITGDCYKPYKEFYGYIFSNGSTGYYEVALGIDEYISVDNYNNAVITIIAPFV